MRYLYLVFIVLLSQTVQAQNVLQKFKLYPGIQSFPNGFYIHENELYFTTNNAAGSSYDLWKTDDTTFTKVGKGKDGGDFPYHYIVGGLSDQLYLMIFNSKGKGFNDGIYTYNLKTDSFTLLQDFDNIAHWPSYVGDNQFYFAASTSSIGKVYRYTISTGKLDDMLTMHADTTYGYVLPMHGRVYIDCQYNASVSVITRAHLHTIDTINKRVSPSTVLPGSVGTYIIRRATIGNDLYFFARGPQHSPGDPPNLYKYSGSGTPTRITFGKDLKPLNDDIVAYNNKIYFSGVYKNSINASLYAIDVTNGNEQLVYRNNNAGYYDQFQPKHFYVHNKRLYMSGYDETKAHQPYVYDGADTPSKVGVLQLYKGISINNVPKQYITYKNNLYFAATDSNVNVELWRFNDTLLRPIPQSISKVSNNAVTNITAYPNPTNADALLSMTLKQAATLSVLLTDINGRVVYRADEQLYSKGKHNITLPMQRLSSGTYIYTVLDNSGQQLNSGRMTKQ